MELIDVYVGPGGVLTGSARLTQEAQEKAEQIARKQEMTRRQFELERKRNRLETQIAALRTEFDEQEAELLRAIEQDQNREAQLTTDREEMARRRKADIRSKKNKGVS